MEAFLLLAVALIGLVAFDILAIEYGADSRTETRDERTQLIDRGFLA